LLVASAVAMPTFASRKGLLKSNKKRKLSIQQSFQRIFAQEFVATNDANGGTNRATPNESMAESLILMPKIVSMNPPWVRFFN
jgi:hypothetical protein